MKVIIYLSNYNSLGGVETFVFNFMRRMNKYFDLTFMFDKADSFELLERAAEFCTVEKLQHNKQYDCDVFICASAWGYEPYNNINAKRYIQMVHAHYDYYFKGWNFKYTKHKKTTHHVCVGNSVKTSFERATPHKCDAVIYNLLNNEIKPLKKIKDKKLHLVTLSRLSGEKGFDRMIKFAEQIPVDYVWNVWGNTSGAYAQQIISKFKHLPKVKFNGITNEPYNEIVKADYLLQLSDSEGYCYSIIEALQMATPVIVTPFESASEQVTEKINGYIIDFEVKNVNFDAIINNIPIFEPYQDKSSEQDWLKIIQL